MKRTGLFCLLAVLGIVVPSPVSAEVLELELDAADLAANNAEILAAGGNPNSRPFLQARLITEIDASRGLALHIVMKSKFAPARMPSFRILEGPVGDPNRPLISSGELEMQHAWINQLPSGSFVPSEFAAWRFDQPVFVYVLRRDGLQEVTLAIHYDITKPAFRYVYRYRVESSIVGIGLCKQAGQVYVDVVGFYIAPDNLPGGGSATVTFGNKFTVNVPTVTTNGPFLFARLKVTPSVYNQKIRRSTTASMDPQNAGIISSWSPRLKVFDKPYNQLNPCF